ncbi:Microtubule-associated protein 70 [Dioscorea alata]|uniref:Microtubule-associated protein 70 n=2 Tax=Dioscorea alata TaxID=55571 RepID=A0ACB7VGH1_DIOAL|nr:Microtubule-associated protein 70 [Dioscorea alata]
MGSLRLQEGGQMETFLTSSHPVMIELNRLENKLRDKERELGVANNEIKALKMMELMKDKAMSEKSNDLLKSDVKLRTTEKQLEDKNLEIKKLRNEKKEALAAQFAAEAALRRVHATQKDVETVPVEDVVAPLQYEIKLYKDEISVLKENNKVLDRVTKSKDMALVEAEKILRSTLEQALIVENMRNQNLELKRQIAILQEENKLLDKTNHQKVVEVQKRTQTIQELEESLLAASAATNTLCEYRCQVSQLNEEKKVLERELAKTKVSANRVAAAVANEWKDENDKVMPAKQQLDKQRFLQGEIQRLRDKLAVSARPVKAEAQVKDRAQLRIEKMEEGLKHVPSLPTKQAEGSNRVIRIISRSMGPNRRSVSQPRGSLIGNRIFTQQQANSAFEGTDSTMNMKQANITVMNHVTGKNMVRKTLSVPRSKFSDDYGKENTRVKANSACSDEEIIFKEVEVSGEVEANKCSDVNSQNTGTTETVSGFLYDRLQKEVICLRKSQELKEGELHTKDDEIKMLLGKVDALTKVIKADSKNMKRELASRGQELLVVKSDNIKQKNRSVSNSKRSIKLPDVSTSSRGA